MDYSLIYGGAATLEDLEALGRLGFEFEINDGQIVGIAAPTIRSESVGR